MRFVQHAVEAPASTVPFQSYISSHAQGHHLYKQPSVSALIESYVASESRRIVLADKSQSLGQKIDYPHASACVELTEVVRCSKRIVQAASAFQLGGKAKLHSTESYHSATGPPLKSFLFETSESTDDAVRYSVYADKVMAALRHVTTTFQGLGLRNRVAILVPDSSFLDGLRPPLLPSMV